MSIITTISQLVHNTPQAIGKFLLLVQDSLEHLLRIRRIERSKLGFLTSLIYFSGFLLIINMLSSTTLSLRLLPALWTVIILLLVWSICSNPDNYTHSLVVLLTIGLGYKTWLYLPVLGSNLGSNYIGLIISLIAIVMLVYCDLVKPNWLLQITIIYLLSLPAITWLMGANSLQVPNVLSVANLGQYWTFYIVPILGEISWKGLVIIPVFVLVSNILMYSRRAFVSVYYKRLLSVCWLLCWVFLSVITPFIGFGLLLITVLSISFYLFLKHNYIWARVYLASFFCLFIFFINQFTGFSPVVINNLLVLCLIWILILSLISKRLVDRSNRL
jgi:hypothetical protein